MMMENGLPVTVNTTPVDGPDNGTIVINADGSYTYTPDLGFVGEDTVCYQCVMRAMLCDTAYLYLEVIEPGAMNSPPVANEDVAQTLEDVPVTGNVLNNDVEPDGDNIILNTTPVRVRSTARLY